MSRGAADPTSPVGAPTPSTSSGSSPWHRQPGELADDLDTDLSSGLSGSEAAARLERHGPNQLEATRPVPTWRKLLEQFADPLVYLLMAAVAVSLLVWVIEGADTVPIEAVVILVIVVANAVLGYVQEERAEAAVAALQRMAAATATVRRDGRKQQISGLEVVPGDVVLLTAGDAVTADARLVEVAGLTVAEASLTGESQAVVKQVPALEGPIGLGDRTNMVFSGTAVTRGRGRALVTATAMDTEMGNVARLLGSTEDRQTPLQEEVHRIGRMLGLAVIAIAIVVMGAILLTSDIEEAADLVDVGLVGVSLAVAAVPEGLPAILSVVLAIGVQRLARQRAIVKRLASVETLGSATVVCSDKTGTLTRNEMTIVRIITASGEVEVGGTGYEPSGELTVDGRPLAANELRNEVECLLQGGTLANNASLHHGEEGWSIQGDPTEAAFLVAEAKLSRGAGPDLTWAEQRRSRFDRVGEVPFSSERKLMSTLNTDRDTGGDLLMASKGAPDVLLERCAEELVAGRPVPLSDERRNEILGHIDRLADQALRTLAVATRRHPEMSAGPEELEESEGLEQLEDELVFLGIVGIIDPARPEAAASVAEARSAGVRTIMITGDHPRTARRIAEDLGIIGPERLAPTRNGAAVTTGDGAGEPVDDPTGGVVLTGSRIEELSDEALLEASRRVSVYARVSPEHKLRIVAALQADGNIVAMTGDGVNDGPALKAADIGVAMGITGTEVAKEAADVILADDNFATIIAAVRQGRAILSNIRKFLRFLLSSNMGEVLTMFFGVMLAGMIGLESGEDGLAVPLLATQILWVNLLSDTAPALAMGVDPPPDDLMERAPRRPGEPLIDRRMWTGIVWVGLVTAVVSLLAFDLGHDGGLVGNGGDLTEGRTMAFTTLVLAQLFNTLNSRSERVSAFHHLFTNPLLWSALALSALLQVAVVHLPFLNTAFDTSPLVAGQWLTCVLLASAVLWASEARKLLGRQLFP